MPDLSIVYGTRPESRKIAPLINGLHDLDLFIARTGQHTSLLHGCNLPDSIDLGYPALDTPDEYARELSEHLAEILPDAPVLVQGDTASAFAGGLAAKLRGLPLIHLEAGIRTGNLNNPWPEEGFRVELDAMADLLLCATEANMAHTTTEGCRGRAVVTGNTGIDALYREVRPHGGTPLNRILVTLHRRESLLDGRMANIIGGIYDVALANPEIEFLWPVHPNPGVAAAQNLAGHAPRNVVCIPPVDPVEFVRMLARSRGVVTDSGGVQEEAAALGVPCAVCRDVSDRPESIANGRAIHAGRMRLGVRDAIERMLDGECIALPSDCFGNGHAVRIIAPLVRDMALTARRDRDQASGHHQLVVGPPAILAPTPVPLDILPDPRRAT